MSIKKYSLAFKAAWQSELEYRSVFVIRVLIALIIVVTALFLWSDVFTGKQTILGYTQAQMVTYYIITSFIYASIFTYIPISDEIMSGETSMYLVRPMNYIVYHYARDLARKTLRIVFGLPVVAMIMFIFRSQVFISNDIKAYLMAIVALFLAMQISFLIDTGLRLLEFWFTNSWSFSFIYDMIMGLFAGMLIPLAFLPAWVNKIGALLPFQYLGAFVADGYLGRYDIVTIAKGMGIQLLWIMILIFVVRAMWLAGIKKYEAYGN